MPENDFSSFHASRSLSRLVPCTSGAWSLTMARSSPHSDFAESFGESTRGFAGSKPVALGD
jgi:hypothetical protein